MQRVLVKKKQKRLISLPTNPKKDTLGAIKLKVACFPTKNLIAVFCDIRLEASN